MGSVTIKNLNKSFDQFNALEDVNLEIQEGEFFALLGPSGCGKTTTMRCIAGFENPTSGEIFIGSRNMNSIPVNKRNCGMVFQSYALFPHLNVFENVAYSLNIRRFYEGGFGKKIAVLANLLNRRLGKVDSKVEKKVRDALDLVELGGLADRFPNQLSGGQQQRVALARALVMEPAVLLMDEPLSNLDKKLRNTMRVTIRKIQQKVGITTIFVTHDQEEAMSMADRVAVMDKGRVIQVARPTELYTNPISNFVADFVGSSNIFKGEIKEKDSGHGTTIKIGGSYLLNTNYSSSKKEFEVMIRPEGIRLLGKNDSNNSVNILNGCITLSTYLGSIVRYDVQVGTLNFEVDTTYEGGNSLLKVGTEVLLEIDPNRVVIL